MRVCEGSVGPGSSGSSGSSGFSTMGLSLGLSDDLPQDAVPISPTSSRGKNGRMFIRQAVGSAGFYGWFWTRVLFWSKFNKKSRAGARLCCIVLLVLCLIDGHQVAVVHFFPIDQVPEGSHIVAPLVLVLQVVGVFPHIQSQNGRATHFSHIHQGIVLIGRTANGQTVVGLYHQPGPAAAELTRSGLVELLLKSLHRTKGLFDGRRKLRRRCSLSPRCQYRPKQVMVVVTAPVVAQGRRQLTYVLKNKFERGVFESRPLQSFHKVVVVALVVATVVQFHSLRIDVGLQCIVGVGQGSKSVLHGNAAVFGNGAGLGLRGLRLVVVLLSRGTATGCECSQG